MEVTTPAAASKNHDCHPGDESPLHHRAMTACAIPQNSRVEHAHAIGWKDAISITLHCLTGCAIGELTGLAIGVSLGWRPPVTIALAVGLSFVSGFALTLIPMVQRGFDFFASLRTVWIGEVISISVMEFVMNIVDYQTGGMRGVSLSSPRYWVAFALALAGGFLIAWPVNRWMLRRNLKRCH